MDFDVVLWIERVLAAARASLRLGSVRTVGRRRVALAQSALQHEDDAAHHVSKVMPERVLELTSYHAIVACVAAGSGITIMPRSVLQAVHAESQVQALPLPRTIAQVHTHLVWRPEHHSVALDALRDELHARKLS